MSQRQTILATVLAGTLVLAAMTAVAGALPLPTASPLKKASTEPEYARCGSDNVALVFKNPDLQPNPQDGKIYASGYFFAQFQAIGEDALKIERFTFSFGKPLPEGADTCDTPEWITGAYIKNYRIDYDPRDGFFVPINTTNVPDGEYAAAVHAYDGAGVEIARYYANAIVDNGAGNERGVLRRDTIQPWPIVLPGDGEQTRDVGGLTIEFAEPIKFLEVRVDGVLIGKYENGVLTGALQEWTPPLYDDDTAPDETPVGKCPTTLALQLAGRSGCRVWGPGFHWPGTPQDGQVIEVKAVDLWDNMANKVLHLGDPTIGGRISLLFPEVEIIGSGQQMAADAMGKAVYPFEFRASGEGGLHGNIVFKTLPQNLTARFSGRGNHIMVKSGEALFTNLTVQALPGLAPGTYDIPGQVIYEKGAIEEYKDFNVKFVLSEAKTDEVEEEFATGKVVEAPPAEPIVQAETPAPTAEAPGLGALAIALGAALAALVIGRRRL